MSESPRAPFPRHSSTEEVPVAPPTVQGPFINTSSENPLLPSGLPDERPSAPDSPAPERETAAPAQPTDTPAATDIDVKQLLGYEQLEEGAKWNQDRLERRMTGEYERAGRQLSELVHEKLDEPFRLNAIRIVGIKATRPSFLSALVAPYLPTLPPPSYLSAASEPTTDPRQTLRSLLSTTRELDGLLSQFDIFKEVTASLEESPSVLAEPQDVDIVLKVKEAPRYFLRTSTDVGDGEGSATGTARIRNAFGGAEMLEGNISAGTRTKSAFQLRLETPVNASPTTKAEISIFSAQRDLNYYASCSEGTRGIQARLKTYSPLGFHEFAYEAVLRKIGDVLPVASVSIRDAAGQSVKSSISHTLVRDTRDDPFLATKGSYFKTRQEYAGLGGDATFAKLDNECSISRSIYPGYTLSLGLRAGLLYPLGGKPSLFPDRYHVGGPTSVRMFRPNAMGPKDNGDFTGGDLHWATGLSLITPVPKRPDWPLKGHFFVNAGRLTRLDQDRPTSASLGNLFSQPSVSVGAGLLYRHSLVRVEVNVGVPLAMGVQEGSVKGLQFGLGMSFL